MALPSDDRLVSLIVGNASDTKRGFLGGQRILDSAPCNPRGALGGWKLTTPVGKRQLQEVDPTVPGDAALYVDPKLLKVGRSALNIQIGKILDIFLTICTPPH